MSAQKSTFRHRLIITLTTALLLCVPATSASASYWGRTTKPVTLNGVPVAPGQYIPIWWDGGEFYYAGPYADADHIPRSAVEIVPRWNIQSQGPAEFNQSRCAYYAVEHDPVRAENALLPDDLKLYQPAGSRAHILYKEGDSYAVRWGEPTPTEDYTAITRRVPADCIRFPAQYPFKGFLTVVPFILARDLQARPTDWSLSHNMWIFFAMPFGIVGLFGLIKLSAYLVFRLAR